MSDKFDMKLVIDPVTTPLLHARLSQAGSARVRAALLRSLAEAALRGNDGSASVTPVKARDVDLSAGSRSVTTTTMRSQPALAIRVEQEPPTAVPGTLSINENGDSAGHDVDQLADAFGSYF